MRREDKMVLTMPDGKISTMVSNLHTFLVLGHFSGLHCYCITS